MLRLRPLTGVFYALLALFLIDAAVFRGTLYTSVLDPESTTGRVELWHFVESHRQPSKRAQVLAFGDSRMGFMPHLVTTPSAGSSVEFANVAVPGTSPRCWYYQLRDLDPDANRYAAVVLPVDDYYDEDRLVDPAEFAVDINYTIARLRLTDLFDFTRSFANWEHRLAAFRGILLKGTVFKDDFQAFLLAPDARRRKAVLYRRDFVSSYRTFFGEDNNVDGLAVDWATGALTVPPGSSTDQEKLLRETLLRPVVEQTGRLAAYRRAWFGRIIDRYRGTATQVIIFRLPRGPIPRPDWLVAKRSSSIRELAARPNVMLLDEHAFESLERTSLFKDPLHLNSKGMKLFSQMLADRIAARLPKMARAD